MAGLSGQTRLPSNRDPRGRRNAAGLASNAEALFSGALVMVNGVLTLNLGAIPALDQANGLTVILGTTSALTLVGGLAVVVKATGGIKADAAGLYLDSAASPTFVGLTLTGNLTVSGTVDGVDVSAIPATYLTITTAASTYQTKPAAGTFPRSFGVLAAAPVTGMAAGDTYYDSVLLNTFIYTGSTWKQIVVL